MIDIYKNELKITYDKSIKGSYIEIKNVNINKESYEFKIITDENINGIIRPEISYDTNKEFFKYNITSLYSLEQYLKYNKLKKKDIVFIIKSIEKLLYDIENYLISENSIYIDLKTVFISKNNNLIEFKYILIPNLNLDFSYEFSKFLIKLMRYVDIDDQDALNLSYELFVKSSKDNYTISDLLEIVNKYKNEFVYDSEFNDILDNGQSIDNYIDYDKEIKNIYEKDLNESKNNNISEITKSPISNNYHGIKYNEIIGEKKYKNINDDKNYLQIDNTTNNILKNELFENFDRVDDYDNGDDLKYEKFKQKMKKSRKKYHNKSSINMFKLMNWIIPIIIILIPIIIYILFGKGFFYKHLFKIVILEIFIIGTYIINMVLDGIDCEQKA